MKTFLSLFLFSFIILTQCTAQNGSNKYFQEPSLIGGLDSLYRSMKIENAHINTCGKKGKVFVTYDISVSGKVINALIAKGLCPMADSLALNIVRKLLYKPAIENGNPIKSVKTIFIPFEQ